MVELNTSFAKMEVPELKVKWKISFSDFPTL